MKLKSFALTSTSVLASAFLASAGEPVETTTAPPPASSGDGGMFDEVGITLSTGWDGDYIFRGVDFGDNLLWTDVNLTLPVADALELNVGSWYASLAEDDYTELNLYAGLSYAVTDSLTIGVGYLRYDFPSSGAEEINEFGATIGYSIAGLDLGAGYYHDDVTDGSYIEVGVGYSIALCESVTLDPGVIVGFGDDYYGVNGGNHVAPRLSLSIQLTESAVLSPYVAYNIPIDSLDDAGEPDEFYGGVSLAVSF
jgi:opacity protein-like surface antigen